MILPLLPVIFAQPFDYNTSTSAHTLQRLARVIAAAKLAGAPANRLGQPAVMGNLLIGFSLGPSMIGVFDMELKQLRTRLSAARGLEFGWVLLRMLAFFGAAFFFGRWLPRLGLPPPRGNA